MLKKVVSCPSVYSKDMMFILQKDLLRYVDTHNMYKNILLYIKIDIIITH